MVKKYGYTHISSGDLLRAEVASGSKRGQKLEKLMKRGLLVPNNIVLDLIKEKMLAEVKSSKGFLIDGYPRQVDQGVEFETEIVPCSLVLYINASDKTMKERLLSRGKSSGRSDDNEESIKQRLRVFHDATEPVIAYYDKQGKLKTINSENSPDEVFAECKKIIDKHNSELTLPVFHLFFLLRY